MELLYTVNCEVADSIEDPWESGMRPNLLTAENSFKINGDTHEKTSVNDLLSLPERMSLCVPFPLMCWDQTPLPDKQLSSITDGIIKACQILFHDTSDDVLIVEKEFEEMLSCVAVALVDEWQGGDDDSERAGISSKALLGNIDCHLQLEEPLMEQFDFSNIVDDVKELLETSAASLAPIVTPDDTDRQMADMLENLAAKNDNSAFKVNVDQCDKLNSANALLELSMSPPKYTLEAPEVPFVEMQETPNIIKEAAKMANAKVNVELESQFEKDKDDQELRQVARIHEEKYLETNRLDYFNKNMLPVPIMYDLIMEPTVSLMDELVESMLREYKQPTPQDVDLSWNPFHDTPDPNLFDPESNEVRCVQVISTADLLGKAFAFIDEDDELIIASKVPFPDTQNAIPISANIPKRNAKISASSNLNRWLQLRGQKVKPALETPTPIVEEPSLKPQVKPKVVDVPEIQSVAPSIKCLVQASVLQRYTLAHSLEVGYRMELILLPDYSGEESELVLPGNVGVVLVPINLLGMQDAATSIIVQIQNLMFTYNGIIIIVECVESKSEVTAPDPFTVPNRQTLHELSLYAEQCPVKLDIVVSPLAKYTAYVVRIISEQCMEQSSLSVQFSDQARFLQATGCFNSWTAQLALNKLSLENMCNSTENQLASVLGSTVPPRCIHQFLQTLVVPEP